MKTVTLVIRNVSDRTVTQLFKDLLKLKATAVCVSGWDTFQVRGNLTQSDLNLLSNRYGKIN